MNSNVAKTITIREDKKRSEDLPFAMTFKWYNWEHADFRLKLDVYQGEVEFYLNRLGETNY